MLGTQLVDVGKITDSARDKLKLAKKITNGAMLGNVTNQLPAEKDTL